MADLVNIHGEIIEDELCVRPGTEEDANHGLMCPADKLKLDNIEAGANKYVHPANHEASIITQDATHRFVSDTEKSTWNNKASTTVASTTANGLMSSTDKSKLEGIAAGANKTVVDSSLSDTSTNPVQNKVINTALADKVSAKPVQVTLPVSGWSDNTQTVTVEGITSDTIVFVSPNSNCHTEYGNCSILCTAQGTNSLTFKCETIPTSDITVNLICMD